MLDVALTIVKTAEEKGATLRLIGGQAIRYHCPSALNGALSRDYPDIDMVGLSSQTRIVKSVMSELGHRANVQFNNLHGGTRLIFYVDGGDQRIDIFLDRFHMCHEIDLRDRLKVARVTIPLADMLLTKLQIVEINEKDVKDIIAILKDHEIDERDEEEIINGRYIAKLCSADWGLQRTVEINFEKVLDIAGNYGINERVIADRIAKLRKMIEEEPKTLRWKMRAKIGERVRWYELPEDVTR